MNSEIKHPRALAIAKRGESALWEMGDYLIETGATIKEVANELMHHGFNQYGPERLKAVRMVAGNFPKSSRINHISFYAHHLAGSPDVLETVIAAAKSEGRPVSGPFVELVMRGVNADKIAKRKGVQIRAEKAAARAEARGDKAGAERNRTRARKLKGAPKRDKSKRHPDAKDVPMMVIKTKFMADSSTIRAWVKRMDRNITPHIDELSPAFITGSVEELLEIAEAIRALATKLNRNQSNKRAHLHAVA